MIEDGAARDGFPTAASSLQPAALTQELAELAASMRDGLAPRIKDR